jgi:2-dehydro-3-deoxy-D-arabinonate dehydratase
VNYHRVRIDDERRLVVNADESFFDLAKIATTMDTGTDAVARHLIEDRNRVDPAVIETASLPVVADEVWAAGVTYQISEEARESESSMPEMYLDVYESDRPELFFKATPSRTVGPNEAVGIRGDSTWDVPEPELGIVLYYGDIIGYTIGNDMSSREIEGSNPLFLPQAKVYDRCCALGPSVASIETINDPHDLHMEIEIRRDGKQIFDDATSTGEMARSCEELVSYFNRHNKAPELAVLMTGTALVPDDEFTLQPDDEIEIFIENIGTLENQVTVV